MKIVLPITFRPGNLVRNFNIPFYLIVFLFFFTLSGDMLSITINPFNFKLNNLVGVIVFTLFCLLFKRLHVPRDFFSVWAYLLCSMSLSTIFGYNPLVCLGFVLYFIYSFFIYFLFPSSLFYHFDSEEIFKGYYWSFVWVGVYATLQVFCSLFGVLLPYVGQLFMNVARGQGFSYEPSYYALYLTPFAIFQTTQFLLRRKDNRKLRDVILPNFLLLVSTSTGCFFSYIVCLICLIAMKKNRLMERIQTGSLVLKFSMAICAVCLILWFLFPAIVTGLFLKFFFVGFSNHGSFSERWSGIVRDWNVFLTHPIFGTGLGGTTSYILMNSGYSGIDLYNRENLVSVLGTNVTMDVLAGLGIVGAIGFVWLMAAMFLTMRKALRIEKLEEEERIRVTALAVSLVVTFFTLQFSQTIFRSYVWVHVGIAIGYAKFLISKYRRQNIKSVR